MPRSRTWSDGGGSSPALRSASAELAPRRRARLPAKLDRGRNAGGGGANPTGSGDLLTCDGTTGVSHGHLVGSLIAGNAQDVVPDVRVLSGFETSIAGSATTHAIDGVASQARLFVIDDQLVAGCAAIEQILQDAQDPGDLSQNLLAGRSFGITNALNLKIHNLSFSRFEPLGGFGTSKYTTESGLNTPYTSSSMMIRLTSSRSWSLGRTKARPRAANFSG